MRVTLVYPDLLLHRPDWTGYFYIGVASLSSVLKKDGHDVTLIHITNQINRDEFISTVKRSAPDLIGFSSTSPVFTFVKTYTGWLADEMLGVKVICGGMHPTIAPEETIGVRGIDIICRGEGEAPIRELCTALEQGGDISGIQNLWIRGDGVIIKNPLRPLLEDLDELPFPDRSIFDYHSLFQEREGRGSFLVARGCPYNCSYCCNHLTRKIYGSEGKQIRFRSVDNVIGEISEVIKTYPFITSLIFDDDILFLRRRWAEEFTEKYSREIGLPFICNARANLINEETVALMKKAGCRHVKFGLESGNEEISSKVLKRKLTNDHIRRAFSLCKQAGLTTESFNMVGVPYDTPATVLDTIKLNAEIHVDSMQVSIFQPYRGTELEGLCLEKHFYQPRDLETSFFSPSILKLDTIAPSQILMFRDYFKVLVRYYQVLYKLPRLLSGMAVRISDAALSFYPVSIMMNLVYTPMNFIYRRLLVWRTKKRT